MTKAEIRRKFDEIVDFSGVERFIDTPVKRYSSGMQVRLAFAVAAHLEPEILVVDEVLAVGDAEFQKRCLGKMEEVASEGGRTILFVSHNMAAIQNLCSRGILLEKGQVQLIDTAERAIQRYSEQVTPSESAGEMLAHHTNRSGNGLIRLTRFGIEDTSGNPLRCASSGKDVVFVFDYEVNGDEMPKRVDMGLSVATGTQQIVFVLYNSYKGHYLEPKSRKGTFRCRVENLPLAAGVYIVGARVVVDNDEADWPKDGVGRLEVEQGDFYGSGSTGFQGSPFLVDGEWEVREATASAAEPSQAGL